MTARFIPSDYPGGRILLRSGLVDVGAIFPPCSDGGLWSWRLFDGFATGPNGVATTELSARNAILTAWRDRLARMDLIEAAP